MKTKNLWCLITSFILVFTFNISAHAQPEIDSPAPDFKAVGHDGETYQLSDLQGQRVILEWYNRDCPFVRKFYDVGKMQEYQKQYAEHAVWLTVVSSREGAQGYMNAAKTKENVEKEKSQAKVVLIDEDGTIGKAYGAKTTPQIVLIDEQGVLRYNGAIDSIPSANSEDIEKARNYLQLGMDELIAGDELTVKRSNPYGCSVKY